MEPSAGNDSAESQDLQRLSAVVIALQTEAETQGPNSTPPEDAEISNRFHSAYTRFLDEKGVGSLSKIDGAKVRVAYGVDRKVMESFVR